MVTGASKSTGLAVARELGTEGARVIVALLASPPAGDVTGANGVIDGGLTKTV